MKKTIALFSLCSILFSLNVTFASFNDTQYSWYRDSIEKLQDDGLVDGIGDGNYGPELAITRAEILTILLRASETEVPELSPGPCFVDVQTNKWYHQYICGAYTLGIAAGFDSGKFQPNASVTTLEALAF